MAVVAAIAAVAAAGIGAYSAVSTGQAQSRMAAYNARIANQNAELAMEQMEIVKKQKDIAAARHARGVEKTLASQRAGWSKAGVEMAGTPLMVAAETMTEADLDTLAIQYASTVEQSQIAAHSAGLRQEATVQGMAGSAARRAGTLGAGSSLLTGVAQGAYYYSQRPKPPPK
mgnify:CR=1 FL=1